MEATLTGRADSSTTHFPNRSRRRAPAVAEPKVTKNRVHLDLRVPDLDAELARLVALGAQHTTGKPVKEDGWIWYVLADPDGNEFCVLRPPRDLV
jgi:predicted enzyme related to lactoylglutathione lyase